MVQYRIGIDGLYDRLIIWNGYLRRKVRLIACGGTALTLLGFKESTKDIDLMVPNSQEYKYLVGVLEDLGYRQVSGHSWRADDVFIFDIYEGNLIHTTELLESPLIPGNHTLVKEFSYIYLGALNDYDLIISKLFRGNSVDFEDCLTLFERRQGAIDMVFLENRFKEAAKYAIGEEKLQTTFDIFIERAKERTRND
jgi:hypothetical protein